MSAAPAEGQTRLQRIFQQQADSLRAELACRPDSAWPDLPERPREVSLAIVADSAGFLSFPSGGVVTSRRVLIPQYAYLLNPTDNVCEPVVIVDSDENLSFIYIRPSVKTGGAAPMVFFKLLGETPPLATSNRTDSASARTDSTSVDSGSAPASSGPAD